MGSSGPVLTFLGLGIDLGGGRIVCPVRRLRVLDEDEEGAKGWNRLAELDNTVRFSRSTEPSCLSLDLPFKRARPASKSRRSLSSLSSFHSEDPLPLAPSSPRSKLSANPYFSLRASSLPSLVTRTFFSPRKVDRSRLLSVSGSSVVRAEYAYRSIKRSSAVFATTSWVVVFSSCEKASAAAVEGLSGSA